eukprot:404440-Prymnesium_polylepis.1
MLHLDARTCGDDPRDTILATRIARKRSASTHMRAHNRGLSVTRRSKRYGSGLQTAFEAKTDFFLLTDLPWATLHGEEKPNPPLRRRMQIVRSGRGMTRRMQKWSPTGVVPQTAFNGPPFRQSCITKFGCEAGRDVSDNTCAPAYGCDFGEEIDLERCVHACL